MPNLRPSADRFDARSLVLAILRIIEHPCANKGTQRVCGKPRRCLLGRCLFRYALPATSPTLALGRLRHNCRRCAILPCELACIQTKARLCIIILSEQVQVRSMLSTAIAPAQDASSGPAMSSSAKVDKYG